MKKVIFFALLALSILSTGCAEWIDWDVNGGHSGDDQYVGISPCEWGDDIHLDSLPQTILDYLNTEFANIEIDDAEVFFDEGQMRYGIRLGNGMEILFDENGVVISSGDDDNEVPVAVDSLLQSILDYVGDNFPGISISDASIEIEFGDIYFEIELDNDIDLYFDHLGNFLCQDDEGEHDDDDDEDGDEDDDGDDEDGDDEDGDEDDEDGEDDDEGPSLGDLPDSILAFLLDLYPNLDIEDIDFDDLCGDTLVIVIELEGEEEEDIAVYFSVEWELLFVEQEISKEELPAAVLDGLAGEYPGYTLEDDDIYQWSMSDGTVQYSLEVETDQDDYWVVIQADGTILCAEED